MRPRAGQLGFVSVFLLVVLFSGMAHGGTWYESGEAGYWSWVEDSPLPYEVLLPSNAYAYIELDWAGHTTLQLPLTATGPMLVVGTIPGTDVPKAFQALTGNWAASLTNVRTTQDQVITTDMGLRPRFMVLTGDGSGAKAMVRMVAFTKENRIVYLLFVGNESDFSGDYRQMWLKAVHSFDWL